MIPSSRWNGVKPFRYPHEAALAVALIREREAAGAFACARDALDSAAREIARLVAATHAIVDQTTRAIECARVAAALDARTLAAGEAALAVLAAHRTLANSEFATCEAAAMRARADLASRHRAREALERHRAAARTAAVMARERQADVDADEASARAREARLRAAGMHAA